MVVGFSARLLNYYFIIIYSTSLRPGPVVCVVCRLLKDEMKSFLHVPVNAKCEFAHNYRTGDVYLMYGPYCTTWYILRIVIHHVYVLCTYAVFKIRPLPRISPFLSTAWKVRSPRADQSPSFPLLSQDSRRLLGRQPFPPCSFIMNNMS